MRTNIETSNRPWLLRVTINNSPLTGSYDIINGGNFSATQLAFYHMQDMANKAGTTFKLKSHETWGKSIHTFIYTTNVDLEIKITLSAKYSIQ